MPFTPQSQTWSGKRAVLLVHGIGNSHPADSDATLQLVQSVLGAERDTVAVYQLFYDHFNDWMVEKTNASALLTAATQSLSAAIADPELNETVSEYIGDILWPVLSSNARAMVREAYLAQLKQMVQDGEAAGVPVRRQKLTIIAHSLGCFHTYEALQHAAKWSTHVLQPASHEVRFANVILMASPVQLIRTVAERMGSLVPNRRWLETVQGDALSIPQEQRTDKSVVLSTKQWISITGNLDPVGGHFFRSRAPWAYMDIAGQQSIVLQQNPTDVTNKAELLNRLRSSALSGSAPTVSPQDPHSWTSYITQQRDALRTWVLA